MSSRFPALVGSIVFALAGCGGGTPPPAPAALPAQPALPACALGRTFIVFRHAEKASPDKDPPLSEKGRLRAETIASMLGHAGITRLVASTYQRTQLTLAPLASSLGVPVEVRAMDRATTPALAGDLRASPDGAVVVVASHSNLLPGLVRDLGGGAPLRGVTGEDLADDDYARLYVIVVPCSEGRPSTPKVLELSSGL